MEGKCRSECKWILVGSRVVKEVGRGCNQGEQRCFGFTRLFQTQDATAST